MYQISFPNFETACRTHTASYSVCNGGSAVQNETPKISTLCHT